MIIGCFSFTDNQSQKGIDDYSSLFDSTNFQNSVIENYESNSLQFKLLHHPDLPGEFRDQYYCDKKEELVVVLIGHVFSQKNNTAQLIADTYSKSGMQFLNSLNGDHSILIFDFKKQETFLVKNQLGTVPISVVEKDGSYFFGSDLIALNKALFSDEKIDDSYLRSKFYDSGRTYDFTPFKPVRKVLPGHYLKITPSEFQETQYWHPEKIKVDESISFQEATAQLSSLVENAVRIRSNKSYTASSHISGGMDSGLIADLARKEYQNQENFTGFTRSPSREFDTSLLPFDERDNIKLQAVKSGLELFYCNIDSQDYNDYLKEWRCPAEFFSEKKFFEYANANKINLIFSGWGGDEFLGIRDEGIRYHAFKELKWKEFMSLNRGTGLKSKVMHFVNSVVLPTRRKKYLVENMDSDILSYLKSKEGNQNQYFKKEWYRTKNGHQLSLLEDHHIAERCEDRYVHGQRNGIEYRYPLLDTQIVEYCLSLPVKVFVGQELDRPLMREICKGHLVDEILVLKHKADPVYMRNALIIQNEALKPYINNLNKLEANSYLRFVDFDRIRKEIQRLKEDKTLKANNLNYVMHIVKSIDEFTKQYHS